MDYKLQESWLRSLVSIALYLGFPHEEKCRKLRYKAMFHLILVAKVSLLNEAEKPGNEAIVCESCNVM